MAGPRGSRLRNGIDGRDWNGRAVGSGQLQLRRGMARNHTAWVPAGSTFRASASKPVSARRVSQGSEKAQRRITAGQGGKRETAKHFCSRPTGRIFDWGMAAFVPIDSSIRALSGCASQRTGCGVSWPRHLLSAEGMVLSSGRRDLGVESLAPMEASPHPARPFALSLVGRAGPRPAGNQASCFGRLFGQLNHSDAPDDVLEVHADAPVPCRACPLERWHAGIPFAVRPISALRKGLAHARASRWTAERGHGGRALLGWVGATALKNPLETAVTAQTIEMRS